MEFDNAFDRFDCNVEGHRFQFVVKPEERLALVMQAIEGARHNLRLYFYIFADGKTGKAVTDALIAAHARGVAVTLLVDGFGTGEQAVQAFERLAEADIAVAQFYPRYGRRYLIRNHQKLLIADDDIAITGGFNIEDSYFVTDHGGKEFWHDLLIGIEGPLVRSIAEYFDGLAEWIQSPNPQLRALNALLARYSDTKGPMRWLLSGPTRRLNVLARTLRADIARAKNIDMIHAYFAPNWGFLRKLGKVARRGRVRLITAGLSDNLTTIAAARHCYRRLLRRGVEIAEFEPSRLHMKLSVIDDAVYVGSANFDVRSLYLNTECVLRIENPALARSFRALIDKHMAISTPVTRASHRARSNWLTRLRWLVAYLIITTLDYRLARNLNWKQA